MNLEAITKTANECINATIFNPHMWAIALPLAAFVLDDPSTNASQLAVYGIAVGFVSTGGLWRYKQLDDDMRKTNNEWTTDLFRNYRAWTVYAWADANGQRSQYRRWRQMYETQKHYGVEDF